LFYYWQWKERNTVYKKASALMMNIFDEINKRITMYKLGLATEDLSFRNGLCGIGWGINLLATNDILECDVQETMCMIDSAIYRQMIEQIQNPAATEFQSAFEIGAYAVSRDDRLTKEYLRRFVNELVKQPRNFSNRDLGLLLRLLQKIAAKHPDIEGTQILYDRYLSQIDISTADLETLLFLASNTDNKELALPELYKQGEILLSRVTDLKIDIGLEHGLVATLHISNMIYQTLKIEAYKELTNRCIEILLNDIPLSGTLSGHKFWVTASQGLWGVHYGLLNGLSGIGLALLGTCTDAQIGSLYDVAAHCSTVPHNS
jgi:hypothetical protein